MRLQDFDFRDVRDSLEVIITWGIWPLRELVEIMDERLMANAEDGYEDRRILFIVNELKYKLEDLEEALQRLVIEN